MNYKALVPYLREFTWALPFVFFLIGYQSFNLLYKSHVITMPHLVGKPLHEALEILSYSKLNTRVTNQKEDPDIKEGTVLQQNPLPEQKIKPHQTVFLITAKQPVRKKTPHFRGKSYLQCMDILKEQRIRHKAFFIEVSHPEGMCIAQIPNTDEPLAQDGTTLYFAIDSNAQVLFPDFKGLSLEEVKRFLEGYSITPTVFHTHSVSERHQCTRCTIKEQKPLAGSFVNVKKPFTVQLKV